MKPYRPSSDPNPVREKFASARKELSSALIEREDEVDLVLTALVANEHVLLVGPPGCGKSLLLDSVLSWTGGTKFSILLTKFSTLEELMGPVSLAALKEDRYVRVTAGKLPEADFRLTRVNHAEALPLRRPERDRGPGGEAPGGHPDRRRIRPGSLVRCDRPGARPGRADRGHVRGR